jgi:hypothetical protein
MQFSLIFVSVAEQFTDVHRWFLSIICFDVSVEIVGELSEPGSSRLLKKGSFSFWHEKHFIRATLSPFSVTAKARAFQLLRGFPAVDALKPLASVETCRQDELTVTPQQSNIVHHLCPTMFIDANCFLVCFLPFLFLKDFSGRLSQLLAKTVCLGSEAGNTGS